MDSLRNRGCVIKGWSQALRGGAQRRGEWQWAEARARKILSRYSKKCFVKVVKKWNRCRGRLQRFVTPDWRRPSAA